MADAVEEFISIKMDNEAWGERTEERTGADLRFFSAESPDSPIHLVSVSWVKSYLRRLKGRAPAVASQQSRFGAVSEFCAWCVRKHYIKSNPCHSVDAIEKPWTGRRARKLRGRGKPQLRNQDEVRAFLKAAMKQNKPDRRVAACLPLLCGMRSGEVRHLRVGDVDLSLGKLWVRENEEDDAELVADAWDVKTASSRRTVDIPDLLRDDLASLCEDRQAEDLMFPSNRNPGQAWERKWLNRMVHRLCQKAGTRDICAHGLRDTYTSLMAAVAQKSVAEIATLLGHADDGKTAREHYIGVPEHRPALQVLDGGVSESGRGRA